MELDNNKKEIIETNESKVIVLSPAGSGKTSIITERIKHLLKNGKENIVALTFTNNAAQEISKRIINSRIELGNTFIGTVHSYCARLLFRHGISEVSTSIEEQDFDNLFNLIKNNNKCIEPVDYLLLDEAQDSTEQQFEFILDVIKPKNYFLIADIRQSIYSFNGARPDILLDLCDIPETKIYKLNINYRCKSNILIFAKNIINKLGYRFEDNSIADKKGGTVFEVEFTPENVLKIIQNSIKNEPENKENNTKYNYKDWFILVRTNNQLNTIYNYLIKNNIPCDTFKQSDLSNSELEKKKQENTVKILTIHSAKGLENKNVIVGSFHFSSKDEERRLAYVAATRAIDNLYWFKPKNKKRKPKIENWED